MGQFGGTTELLPSTHVTGTPWHVLAYLDIKPGRAATLDIRTDSASCRIITFYHYHNILNIRPLIHY